MKIAMNEGFASTIAVIASAIAATGSLLVAWRSLQSSVHDSASSVLNMYFVRADRLHQMLMEYLEETLKATEQDADRESYWMYRGKTSFIAYLDIVDYICTQYLWGDFPKRLFEYYMRPVVVQVCASKEFWQHAERFEVSWELTMHENILHAYYRLMELGFDVSPEGEQSGSREAKSR